MPKAPAIIGSMVQSAIGRRARVTEVTEVAPGFLEVGFQAEIPPGGWQPAHEVQVRATPVDGRRYTVREVDPASPDHIRVLAALDAGGPGTTWLRSLHRGAEEILLGARFVPLRRHGSRRLYLGDGSALGTFDAYAQETPDRIVVVEVPQEAVDGLSKRWPDYRFLPAREEPGDAAQEWIERTFGGEDRPSIDGALLLGHAQSIQRQRAALLALDVLDRRAVSTKPYWSTGRAGL